jgi:glycerophosphoryl diester phosphodiesterase
VELDVRTSGDGEVVVFHDETLERLTGSRDARRVSEVAARELTAIDLGGASIPRLADVLRWALDHRVAVNVELKHDVRSRLELVRATAKAVRDKPADVLFSSFDPVSLAMIAAFAPHVPRALLTQSRGPAWQSVAIAFARRPWTEALHLEDRQAESYVSTCRRRGIRAGVWTVNDPSRAAALVRLGVGTVITDVPDKVMAAVSPRR